MAARGRPRLTPEVLAERIAAYCARYGVTDRTPPGFPPFPAGKRETPQHREWVVLFKARSRLETAGSRDTRLVLLAAQAGRCPICLEEIQAADGLVVPGAALTEARVLVHAPCGKLLGAARDLGPNALDRARALLWPAGRGRRPK